MILSTQSIRRLVHSGEIIIEPFHERTIEHGRTFGLSACGYDIRLGEDVRVWPFVGRLSFALERIGLPDWIRCRLDNKSTNARQFIDASRVTNAEPGWRGHLTLELTRDRPWPVFLPKGLPIAQLVFETLDEPTEQPYGAGKYQDQPAAVIPALFSEAR